MILNSPYISGSLTVTGNIISSGSITISGSIASASYATNAEKLDNLDSTSFVFTSSYNTDSASVSTRVTKIEGNYATTGSNVFMGAQTVCANITSTGTIIAQTLNVQQVTSSIVYSSGSNTFGCLPSNVQQFTGSLRVTGSGNHYILGGSVGIGTLSPDPGAVLSVNKTGAGLQDAVYLTNTQAAAADTGINFWFLGGPSLNSLGRIATGWTGATTTTSYMSFYTRGDGSTTEKMRITSSGSVGIGATDPVKTLDVRGTLAISNNVSSYWYMDRDDSDGRFKILTDTNCEAFTITTTRNVGIGTSSPNLSGAAAGSTVLTLAATSTGRNALIELNGCRVSSGDFIGYLRFFNNTAATPGAEIYALRGASDVSGSLGFATSGTEVVRITCTGNVGIGTSSPTNGKLEVQQSATTAGLWVQTGGTTTSYTVADFRTGTNLSALQILGNGVSSFGSNVAINTTGSAWGNPTTGRVLQIGTVSALFTYNNTTTDLAYNHYFDGADYRYQKTDGASMFRQVSGDFVFYNTGSGAAGAVANFTEKVRITCAGSVVIGQPTPEAVLTVCAEGRGTGALRLKASATYSAISIGGTGTLTVDYPGVSAGRMNLTDDGYLYLPRIRSGAGTYALKWGSGGGEITYDTSSERYKNNIRDSIYGLCHVMRLNSKMFEYKDSNRTDVGLIAEEVYPVIPELVILDDNCLPNAVSYDRFISVLVKAVQELKCQNDIFKTCLGIG